MKNATAIVSPCEAGGVPAKPGWRANAAALIMSAALFSASALACNCDEPKPLADVIRAYDVIFTGKPVKLGSTDDWPITTFEVTETFKGRSMAVREVFHRMGASSMVVFDDGENLIFAQERNERLEHSGPCTGVNRASHPTSDEEIRRVVKEQAEEAK